MSEFADVSDEREGKFKKLRFLKIIPGYPLRVRILNEKALKIHKHFLPKQYASVVCLGWEVCPICQHNNELVEANPDKEYRDIKGIIPRQTRYLVNVYNKTVAKTTPSGRVIYASFDGSFPVQDQETGELLTDIEEKPLNTIEILERGKRLFTKLNDKNKTVLDPETKKPVGLWNYDITLTASGKGRKMDIDVDLHPEDNEPIEFDPEELFVLETVPLQLAPDEMRLALEGVSLRDIFEERKARRAMEEGKDSTREDIAPELLDEISEDIEGILSADDDDDDGPPF